METKNIINIFIKNKGQRLNSENAKKKMTIMENSWVSFVDNHLYFTQKKKQK